MIYSNGIGKSTVMGEAKGMHVMEKAFHKYQWEM